MRPSMIRPLTRARLASRKFSPAAFTPARSLFHKTAVLRDGLWTSPKRKSNEPYHHLEAVKSPISAAHIEAQDLVVVDRILEPQTVANFVGFLMGNPLPDGTRPSSIATLPLEEFALIQGSEQVLGADSMSFFHRVMLYVGSNEDGSRLCDVGKNIQSLKSRLWSGITPLSDQRWKEKGLHLPENFDQACQNLGAVVSVFEYLNVPEVQNNLRETFNLIYDTWSDLDVVINQRRAQTSAEPLSVADLWTLYMSVHLEVMTQRAHKWVTQHVDTLRAPFMQELLAYQPQGQEGYKLDTKQWQLADALHVLLETSVQADHTIMIPMEGYKGYEAPDNKVGPPEMHSAKHEERRAAYSQRVKDLSHKILMDRFFERVAKGEKPRQLTVSKEIYEFATEQVDAQREIRRELRGSSLDSTVQEPWITSKWDKLKYLENNDLPKDSGLAIYHGKELGLAQDDIEAAKQHFNEVLSDSKGPDAPPLDLQPKAILAIDSASFASYMSNSHDATRSSVLPGDSTGFVVAIDPEFDPEIGFDRPDESPDYKGQMRVLGSLVWGDLYAILESQSAGLGELWPLAMHHPDQIYVGPVIPIQRFHWQAQKDGQWKVISEAMNYLGKSLK
ncbi:hypothetical protein N7481_006094 [Penicillium waksmanii]|uniref:uncharacterized protein n=1 Tax=Penicillium waksmanii TaxID=69791 RepID=UPI002549460E|nr:uncharacterized protein N7481_006094 [Penicillium waksmanii]KAJ5983995.1 hypothetical protein N7481_006094 [Penicillium waksmanii]